MTDDRLGNSPFAYKQWDDKPTWMLDRGRDDHGQHPSDDHLRTGFHASLVSHRDKTAQMTDAAVAFIGFKKSAGIMGAVKSLGGMAAKNPHLTGAAVGAAGGALAGGPNHRLSGAAVGGALGAGVGHAVSKMAPTMASAAKPAVSTSTGLANQSPGVIEAAKSELSGGMGAVKGVGQAPAAGPAPGYSPPATDSAKTQIIQTHRQPIPAPSNNPLPPPSPAPTSEMPNSSWLSNLGSQNQQNFDTHIQRMMAGTPAAANRTAMGTPPGRMVKKAAWLPPFVIADDSQIAAESGGSSAKLAAVISELAQIADHGPTGGGKLRIPGMGAVVGVVDDFAQIGRQKLQAMISRHQSQNNQQPQPAAVKMAAGADGSPLMDMRQRAAERFPEKVSPIEAIRTDFKSALQLIQDKIHDLGNLRHGFSQQKIASVGLDYKELARAGGMPKQLMNRQGLMIAGAGALLGGGLSLYASRGKKEHGGRSQAEVDFASAKSRQPENPNGIRQAVGKHVINLHHDVAEQMRKHPIAATAMGAGTGAGIALKLAPLLGIASHIK